ncbi:MAG: dual specificity protein phosphatase family protein [Bacteroidota bacterium]
MYNNRIQKIICVGSLLIIALNNYGQEQKQREQLQKIQSRHFKRLYSLNDSVYRSEQPSKKGFKELEKLGIKTSITFRRNKDDSKKARETGLSLVHIPLKTAELNESDIVESLKAIQNAEKPVLVHCWHGSDRTGAIMAAYRVVFENWSKEKAISELRRPELGYHEKWYPNVVDLISSLNPVEIKKEIDF